MPPQRVSFWGRVGSENIAILVWNQVWFSREPEEWTSFQLLMSKKEKVICKFEMDFTLTFFQFWRSDLSNDDITWIRTTTKKDFLKSISNSYISPSFLLIWIETINTFIHSSISLPMCDFRPKWAKCIPIFRPKRCKIPTWWGGTYG